MRWYLSQCDCLYHSMCWVTIFVLCTHNNTQCKKEYKILLCIFLNSVVWHWIFQIFTRCSYQLKCHALSDTCSHSIGILWPHQTMHAKSDLDGPNKWNVSKRWLQWRPLLIDHYAHTLWLRITNGAKKLWFDRMDIMTVIWLVSLSEVIRLIGQPWADLASIVYVAIISR